MGSHLDNDIHRLIGIPVTSSLTTNDFTAAPTEKAKQKSAIVIKNVYYEQLIIIYTTLGHNSSNFKSNWYLVRGWVKLREGLQTKITNTEY